MGDLRGTGSTDSVHGRDTRGRWLAPTLPDESRLWERFELAVNHQCAADKQQSGFHLWDARQDPSLQNYQFRSWARLDIVGAARFGCVCNLRPNGTPPRFPCAMFECHKFGQEKRALRRLVGCGPEQHRTEDCSQPEFAKVPLVVLPPTRNGTGMPTRSSRCVPALVRDDDATPTCH